MPCSHCGNEISKESDHDAVCPQRNLGATVPEPEVGLLGEYTVIQHREGKIVTVVSFDVNSILGSRRDTTPIDWTDSPFADKLRAIEGEILGALEAATSTPARLAAPARAPLALVPDEPRVALHPEASPSAEEQPAKLGLVGAAGTKKAARRPDKLSPPAVVVDMDDED